MHTSNFFKLSVVLFDICNTSGKSHQIGVYIGNQVESRNNEVFYPSFRLATPGDFSQFPLLSCAWQCMCLGVLYFPSLLIWGLANG